MVSGTGEQTHFDLRRQGAHTRYVVRSIFGTDIDELTPRFTGFSIDGLQRFYDFKLQARDIVIRLSLNPRFKLNEAPSDIRGELYKQVSATRTGLLELHFHSGASTIAKIEGHIVKFEAPPFTQTPEVQITVRCKDPMFRGINPIELGDTELPTANPVILVDGESNAPHGFDMQLTFTNTVAVFAIQDQNPNPNWKFEITPATSFLSGDVLHFSSEFNNKKLYMVRSGVTTHLLDRVNPTSLWPVIFPGTNEFFFWNIGEVDLDLITYKPAYWGV
jgi:hypothetical protein